MACLRPLTRSAGLSFGDRACLALGERLGLCALAPEPWWVGLTLGVRLEVSPTWCAIPQAR
ncbi:MULTISPECIES: hypothetical protein [Thermus]|uniref:Uncharacterized protein n=1 Tax=Thermus brockianus TaxID=56956 RepID=A0ABN6NL11_THEBO|nr:hypothetical protein [Thermus brockianus]BDG17752.1 hypothetical protein TbrSNM41_24860 [Thermus brockianus]